MNTFFSWLYAEHRNFLVATFFLFEIPMYLLVVCIAYPADLTTLLIFAGSTTAGSLLFAVGMWFCAGKHVIERRKLRVTPAARHPA
jgi:hypothetical protein